MGETGQENTCVIHGCGFQCPKCLAPTSATEGERDSELFISKSALLKLADESDKVGATRYAAAYRLVAERLEEVNNG